MMKSYVELLNEALDEALQKDSRVFLVGEDIGEYGGCFGASRGLLLKLNWLVSKSQRRACWIA